MGQGAVTRTAQVSLVSEARIGMKLKTMYLIRKGKKVMKTDLIALPIKVDKETGRIKQTAMSAVAPKFKKAMKREKSFLARVARNPGKWPVATVEEKLGYIKKVINLSPRPLHKGKGVRRFAKTPTSIPRRTVGAPAAPRVPRGRKYKIHIGLVRVPKGATKGKELGRKVWVKQKLIKISTAQSKKYPVKFTFPLKKGEVMIFWTNNDAVNFVKEYYEKGDRLITVGEPLVATKY